MPKKNRGYEKQILPFTSAVYKTLYDPPSHIVSPIPCFTSIIPCSTRFSMVFYAFLKTFSIHFQKQAFDIFVAGIISSGIKFLRLAQVFTRLIFPAKPFVKNAKLV